MDRAEQLRERDIRNGAPEVNPSEFLRRYLASNFMETGAHPSKYQRENNQTQSQEAENALKYMQKPRQGTTYDNPGGF